MLTAEISCCSYAVPTFPAPGARIRRTPEIDAAVAEQKRAFKAKFGREIQEGDPLIFDPNADEPQPMPHEDMMQVWDALCNIMIEAGVDPASVYASRKLGRMPTAASMKRMTEDEAEAWRAAVDEYHAMYATVQ